MRRIFYFLFLSFYFSHSICFGTRYFSDVEIITEDDSGHEVNPFPPRLTQLSSKNYTFDSVAYWKNGKNTSIKTLPRSFTLDMSPQIAVLSPKGDLLAITTKRHKTGIYIVDVQSGKLVSVLLGHTGLITSMIFYEEGARLLTASSDGSCRFWNVRNGTELNQIFVDGKGFTSASLSKDQTKLLTRDIESSIYLWDTKTQKALLTIPETNSVYNTAIFSPDEKQILATSTPANINTWDIETATLTHSFSPQQGLTSASFSPDNRTILTTTLKNNPEIWDRKTGVKLHTLKGHSKFVISGSYSVDSQLILTYSIDQTAKIWEAKSGELLHTINLNTRLIAFAVFSPNSRSVITISLCGEISEWKPWSQLGSKESRGIQKRKKTCSIQ